MFMCKLYSLISKQKIDFFRSAKINKLSDLCEIHKICITKNCVENESLKETIKKLCF